MFKTNLEVTKIKVSIIFNINIQYMNSPLNTHTDTNAVSRNAIQKYAFVELHVFKACKILHAHWDDLTSAFVLRMSNGSTRSFTGLNCNSLPTSLLFLVSHTASKVLLTNLITSLSTVNPSMTTTTPGPTFKEPKLFKAGFKKPLVIWPHPSFQIHHCHSTPTTVSSTFPFFHPFHCPGKTFPSFSPCFTPMHDPVLTSKVISVITSATPSFSIYHSSYQNELQLFLFTTLLQVKDCCLMHLGRTSPLGQILANSKYSPMFAEWMMSGYAKFYSLIQVILCQPKDV